MKLFPKDRDDQSNNTGMHNKIAPVELNDGIYLHNVRHDKVTLTPFFNGYVPLKGASIPGGATSSSYHVGGYRMDLPFSCCRGINNAQNMMETHPEQLYMYQTYDWCDHEHFCKGEARKIGHTGYSFINSESKEFYMPMGTHYCASNYIKKDKDSHLEFDWMDGNINNAYNYTNINASGTHGTYNNCLYILDENLYKSNPNLIVCGNSAYGGANRGYLLFGAFGNSSSVTSCEVGPSSSSVGSTNYSGIAHTAYTCPQFVTRSAEYIINCYQRQYYGVSYFYIRRYNKATNTVTSLLDTSWTNGRIIPTISNSITDENNADIEHCWMFANNTTSSGQPNWILYHMAINKVTGTLVRNESENPSGYNNTNTPTDQPDASYYGTNNRSECFVTEVGTKGEDVASGSLIVGDDYRVVDDTVTYNSADYVVGKLVTCVTGQLAYTGGKLQTVTKKFVSLMPTAKNFDFWSATEIAQWFKITTWRIPNDDLGTIMYEQAVVNTAINVRPELAGANSAGTGGTGTAAIIKTFCALDPYYNRVLTLTSTAATIMQLDKTGTWSVVQSFLGAWHTAGMDSTGRLYLQGMYGTSGGGGALHMYTTDLPYQVSVIPNKTAYTYAGTTLNTHLSAEATNFEGNNVQTLLKLSIHGSAARFTDGTNSKTITTSLTLPIKVEFNVVAGGYFKIDAEATSN